MRAGSGIIPIIPIIARSPEKPFRSTHSSKTALKIDRVHRWAGARGGGWRLIDLSEHCKVYRTLRLRPGAAGRGATAKTAFKTIL